MLPTGRYWPKWMDRSSMDEFICFEINIILFMILDFIISLHLCGVVDELEIRMGIYWPFCYLPFVLCGVNGTQHCETILKLQEYRLECDRTTNSMVILFHIEFHSYCVVFSNSPPSSARWQRQTCYYFIHSARCGHTLNFTTKSKFSLSSWTESIVAVREAGELVLHR